MKNIFAGNIPFSANADDIRALFEQYGEVSSAKVITDRDTGRSRGFGFVEMPEEQAEALRLQNKTPLQYTTVGLRNWRAMKEAGIGMAMSPVNPDVLYAIIEAADGKSGVFRSVDRGESWTKQSSKLSNSPQYYNELVPDPKNVDVLYCLDTYTSISVDAGKTCQCA